MDFTDFQDLLASNVERCEKVRSPARVRTRDGREYEGLVRPSRPSGAIVVLDTHTPEWAKSRYTEHVVSLRDVVALSIYHEELPPGWK